MQRVYVREELEASADTVWGLVRDFGDIRAWAPGGKVLDVDGEGVGAIRRVDTPGGLFVERCETHDEQARTFSYALLESPMPFSGYVAVVKLTPLDGGRCAIEWSCEFEADPGVAAALREGIEKTYRAGFIASLRQSLGAAG